MYTRAPTKQSKSKNGITHLTHGKLCATCALFILRLRFCCPVLITGLLSGTASTPSPSRTGTSLRHWTRRKTLPAKTSSLTTRSTAAVAAALKETMPKSERVPGVDRAMSLVRLNMRTKYSKRWHREREMARQAEWQRLQAEEALERDPNNLFAGWVWSKHPPRRCPGRACGLINSKTCPYCRHYDPTYNPPRLEPPLRPDERTLSGLDMRVRDRNKYLVMDRGDTILWR